MPKSSFELSQNPWGDRLFRVSLKKKILFDQREGYYNVW